MQIKNLQIFNSIAAADGAWIDVSNLVNLSVYFTGVEANVWVEVSNDPNVNYDGTAIGPPAAGPVLSAVNTTAYYGNLTNQGTLFVKTTIVTPWGETTASPETSLAIPDGKILLVSPPVLTATQALTAIGWNVYVGKLSNTEVLQTMPQFAAQRVVDTGGIHWATAGALPLTGNGSKIPFSLVNGYQNTTVVPPSGDNSGGVNTGVNISGNLPGTPATGSQIQISGATTTWMFNPSGLCWKWLRVRKDATTHVLATAAYLMGQNG